MTTEDHQSNSTTAQHHDKALRNPPKSMQDILGRHVLSCILSYLTETEGTSFLVTNRLYATQLLPLFRLPPTSLTVVNGAGTKPTKTRHRHKFVVVPVQDPTVLLARLNTRRLFQRLRRPMVQQQHDVTATQEETSSSLPCYPPTGQDTVQLAHGDCDPDNDDDDTPNGLWRPTVTPCLLRFLDPREACPDGLTLLVSYPRSGNTLVRSLLERITGVVTGSDTRPSRNLSLELSHQHNLVGEGCCLGPLSSSLSSSNKSSSNNSPSHHNITTGRVAVCKSHWPERPGYVSFAAHRAILLVRNPFDAMDSYWNMNATCTHTQTVTDAIYHQFQDLYQDLIRNEIRMWIKFHEYWLHDVCHNDSKDQNNNHNSTKKHNKARPQIPILVVRFEELMLQPKVELRKILQFLFQVDTLSQAWVHRIDQVLSGHSLFDLGSYQPRSTTTTCAVPTTDDTAPCGTLSPTTALCDMTCVAWNAVGSTSQSPSTPKDSTPSKTADSTPVDIAGTTEDCHTASSSPTNPAIGSIGKSLRKGRYTSDMIQYIHDTTQSFPINYLQRFGYDMMEQDFPHNFLDSLLPAEEDSTRPTETSIPPLPPPNYLSGSITPLRVNQGTPIRPLDCRFGRKMTHWRHSVTNGDRNPLPVVPKN